MTPKERAVMQQALEALENERSHMTANWDNIVKAITALREALAEPDMNLSCKSVQARLATSWGYVKADQEEQEPVGEVVMESMGVGDAQIVRFRMNGRIPPVGTKLYVDPVRTKDLTEYELDELRFQNLNYLDFARAVIAADREKNK